jgi:hypothetical protein
MYYSSYSDIMGVTLTMLMWWASTVGFLQMLPPISG